ncbi:MULTISPECIES: glycosyl hydrolase family 8 [Paenibacillus]|uniref:glycosyl hydrolase family 8 n=1 Tax=Paenibacillus TaxID=44249 RepID=UPI0022B9140B|nr:glycosyl hydrolase family 8 [Paenibacillus caseinilyticus]MCZ8523522.1 glycosyl hydrolase family 8 [Paenibacillus caseinilyticus]
MTFLNKGLLSFSVLLILLIGCTLIPLKQNSILMPDASSHRKADPMLPGESFIRAHMTNSDGSLRTYLKPSDRSEPDTAYGHEALSESMGLWLLYAVEKGDPELFQQAAQAVEQTFMKSDGWIQWKAGGTAPVNTNALVDDMRIAYALYLGGSKWEDAEYTKMADTITDNVLGTQVVDSGFRDFYDHKQQWTSTGLTLSYLNAFAIVNLYEQSKMPEDLYQKTKNFLLSVPTKDGFYPFSYDYGSGQYTYHDKINLIDQLLIEQSQIKLGNGESAFWSFVKNTFREQGSLYGQYDRVSKAPVVAYESPAVYGFAIMFAIENGEADLARDLYYRMIRFQTLKPESEYYGGYMNYQQGDTHIFDNLVPLLAERMLYNAQLLQ